MNNGLWLLPSLDRPHNLARFFRACREIGVQTPGLVLIDEEDHGRHRDAYRELWLPARWKLKITKGVTQGDKFRETWSRYRDADWIGYLGDDCVPDTVGWDQMLLARLLGWNFVSPNDAWQAPNRIGNCAVFSGDLIRKVGYFWPPGLQHLFIDDLWEGLGRETGCWHQRMDVIVRHVHVLKGEAPEDETHRKAYSPQRWEEDGATYRTWQAESRSAAVDAIRQLQAERGVAIVKADLANVNLMIATPAIDDKFESAYVTSLFQTFGLIQGQGGAYQWTVERYTADIALARARLLAAFIHSKCSHCLMIDSDMGWGMEAVIRVFAADKPLCAVAGPKKPYPLRFAVDHSDADGNPVLIKPENERGAAEVSRVGLAFALISRECAEKMVAAYPELTFSSGANQDAFSLFQPMVRDRRYYGEDFAFCERWRAIGGQVYICADVRLKHVGAHTFEGSLYDVEPVRQQPLPGEEKAAAE